MSDGPTRNIEPSRNTPEQMEWHRRHDQLIRETPWSGAEIPRAFPIFSSRQTIAALLERYEVFKLASQVHGSFVECGVAAGFGLMALAHFTTVFEPYNYTRRVVGFDTFAGFGEPDEKDRTSGAEHMRQGGLAYDSLDTLRKAIALHDDNRPLSHLQKVTLVEGDVSATLPAYLEEHPEMVVALLHLDLDLYRPTRDVLTLLWERIPRGGVVVFDELNHPDYPGETTAVVDTLGLGSLELRRLPFAATSCFAVKA